jgi:acyl-CoA thioesterase
VDTTFDRDTAVRRRAPADGHAADGALATSGASTTLSVEAAAALATATAAVFDADVSPAWRAGRGPHGGYLAAMLLRALTETVADPQRAPRSLTIHYARAPEPGPVEIETRIERAGRSLSTLSARMEQDGRLMALALAAFSIPWSAPEISDLPLPAVEPPAPRDGQPLPPHALAPPFARHMEFQPRMGTMPFTGAQAPMEVGGWLALAEPRPLDTLALAFFSDALFSPPFIRLDQPAVTPTIDLTIHFRSQPAARQPAAAADAGADAPLASARASSTPPVEHCFARFRSTLVHDGFFEEDGVIWAGDGTVLLHSRQLAIVMTLDDSGHVVH